MTKQNIIIAYVGANIDNATKVSIPGATAVWCHSLNAKGLRKVSILSWNVRIYTITYNKWMQNILFSFPPYAMQTTFYVILYFKVCLNWVL